MPPPEELPTVSDGIAPPAARVQHRQSALSADPQVNRAEVVKLLNEALATELVCVLRYTRHYYMARGLDAEVVADEFLRNAEDEQEHVERITQRIHQLNGDPNLSPEGMLSRSHFEYTARASISDLIREEQSAEQTSAKSLIELLQRLGGRDMISRLVLEAIVARSERHLTRLTAMLSRKTLAPA